MERAPTTSTAAVARNNKSYQDYATAQQDHDHEDSSLLLLPHPSIEGSLMMPASSKNNNNKGGNQQSNFPEKLHYILNEMEKDGLGHIVSWQPHGRSFAVHDVKLFERDILPNWFRQSKFASFQRQLNIYGFTRIPIGIDKGAYYHELFLRGKQFLAKRIFRTKVKGKGPRKSVAPEDLPDLYSFPFLPATKASQASDPGTSLATQAVVHQKAEYQAPVSSYFAAVATPSSTSSNTNNNNHDGSCLTHTALLDLLSSPQQRAISLNELCLREAAGVNSLLASLRPQQQNCQVSLPTPTAQLSSAVATASSTSSSSATSLAAPIRSSNDPVWQLLVAQQQRRYEEAIEALIGQMLRDR